MSETTSQYHTLWTTSSSSEQEPEEYDYMQTIPKFEESSIDFRQLTNQPLVGSSNRQNTVDLVSNEDMYRFLGRGFCPLPQQQIPRPVVQPPAPEVVVKTYDTVPPPKPPRLGQVTSTAATQPVAIDSNSRKAPKPLPRTKFLHNNSKAPPKLPAKPPVPKWPAK